MRIKNTIKGMSLAKYKKKYFDCMAPDCEGIQKDRGLCPIHLKLFQENIDKKVLPDWSVIEKEGHCMAPGVPEELWDKRGRRSPPLDCRTKDCGNKAKSRGLCVNCYQVAYRFVQRRKTTWEELEERGITTSSYNKRKPEVTTALHKLIEADSGPLEEADRHLGRKPPAEEPEAIQKRMSKAFEKFVFKPPMTKEQGEEELRNMEDEVGKALAEHIFEPCLAEPEPEEPAAPIGQPSPEKPTLDWMKDSKLGEDTILTGDLDKLGGLALTTNENQGEKS